MKKRRDGKTEGARLYANIWAQRPYLGIVWLGSLDTQFLHFRLEGCSFQTKNLGGTARSGKAPTGLLQHGHQMHSLHILEVIRGVWSSEDARLGT